MSLVHVGRGALAASAGSPRCPQACRQAARTRPPPPVADDDIATEEAVPKDGAEVRTPPCAPEIPRPWETLRDGAGRDFPRDGSANHCASGWYKLKARHARPAPPGHRAVNTCCDKCPARFYCPVGPRSGGAGRADASRGVGRPWPGAARLAARPADRATCRPAALALRHAAPRRETRAISLRFTALRGAAPAGRQGPLVRYTAVTRPTAGRSLAERSAGPAMASSRRRPARRGAHGGPICRRRPGWPRPYTEPAHLSSPRSLPSARRGLWAFVHFCPLLSLLPLECAHSGRTGIVAEECSTGSAFLISGGQKVDLRKRATLLSRDQYAFD